MMTLQLVWVLLKVPETKGVSLHFDTRLSVGAGFLKADGKYNNEYEEKGVPQESGYAVRLRSTNYFGLNWRATNITAALACGISCSL